MKGSKQNERNNNQKNQRKPHIQRTKNNNRPIYLRSNRRWKNLALLNIKYRQNLVRPERKTIRRMGTNKIKEKRIALGLKQSECAEKAQIAQPNWARLENGSRDIKNISL